MKNDKNTKTVEERVTVKDKVLNAKGIISIYDDKGNLIAEAHNMIVFSGIKLIFNLFLAGIGVNSDQNDYTGTLYFNFGYIGDARITKLDSTYDDFFVSGNTNCTKIDTSEIDITMIDNTELSFTITKNLTGTSEFQQFDEIGLSYTENGSPEQILFSRAAIDPVYLGVDGKYRMKYKIYF